MTHSIGLFGSGFLGSATRQALPESSTVRLSTPRLRTSARTLHQLAAAARRVDTEDLEASLSGLSVLINTAGNPDASSNDVDSLFGANALWPLVLLRAAESAGVERLVHVSSAVVQNDISILDSSEDLRPFSPYSSSKCLGEEVLREHASTVTVVRYRPPSVHAHDRRITRSLRGFAKSPLTTVAKPGTQPTPQALLENVASAIAFISLFDGPVPNVVHHPSEGLTVSTLLQHLSGGRVPRRLPRPICAWVVGAAKATGRVHSATSANARRLELLWQGQEQAVSWLELQGWEAPLGHRGWKNLGQQ